MELVYLWVEEYKNIRNQGFNFSPRFECEFDGKNLTINENKDYVSIFPDNINVTAIVGENGSGKSSILIKILDLALNYDYKICIYNKKSNQIYSNIEINEKSKLINTKFNFTNTQLINSCFFYHYKNDIDLPILENRHGIYNPYEKIFTEPNKGNNILKIKEQEKNMEKRLISLVKDEFYKEIKTNEFFVPAYISLKFNNINYGIDYIQKREQLKNKLKPRELLLIDTFIYLESLYKKDGHNFELKNVKCFDNEILSSENLQDIIEDYYQQLLNNNYIEQIKEQKEKATQTNKYNEKIEILIEAEKSLKLIKNLDIFLSLLDGKYDFCNILINKLKESHENIDLIKNLPDFIKLDFYSTRTNNYSKLSTGEKSFLEIIYSIREIISLRKKNKLSQNIFLLLDEIENNLHPNWQKKLLNILISICKVYDIQIHLIITSHSPFILSDLPKENVIFLKDGEQSKVDIDTFGANIHTLLSNGFFMSDGLMGEFAKSKIRIIQITYKYILHRHKQKSLNKKEHKKSRRFIKIQLKILWHIQAIIGENFLQTIMKNYLQEIEEIFFGNEKAIDNEIERLQNLRKSIKNAKN